MKKFQRMLLEVSPRQKTRRFPSDANRKRMLDVSCSSVSRLFSPSEPKQQKLTNVVNSQKKHEVDMSVARMCCSTGISFNVVNNKHFSAPKWSSVANTRPGFRRSRTKRRATRSQNCCSPKSFGKSVRSISTSMSQFFSYFD